MGFDWTFCGVCAYYEEIYLKIFLKTDWGAKLNMVSKFLCHIGFSEESVHFNSFSEKALHQKISSEACLRLLFEYGGNAASFSIGLTGKKCAIKQRKWSCTRGQDCLFSKALHSCSFDSEKVLMKSQVPLSQSDCFRNGIWRAPSSLALKGQRGEFWHSAWGRNGLT